MTKKRDYIPTKQADRISNGRVFKEQAVIDGTAFGLTTAQKDALTEAFTNFNTEYEAGITMDGLRQEQTEKTTLKDKIYEALWRQAAGSVKAHASYDASVGERYKIIGDEMSIDIATSKPELKISKVADGTQLTFSLKGFFSGVKIYRKRPTDTSFSYIATDLSSPYIDTDAQVNGTQYYAYYLRGDHAVGLQGDIVTAQV